MHIDYSRSNGIEYANVCKTVRVGSKVRKERTRYLGRVIDKDKGIFRRKDCGIYMYNLETDEIKLLPPTYAVPKFSRKNIPSRQKTLGLSFGDVYLVSELLKKSGLLSAIDAIGYENMDTLYSLLQYYVTQSRSNFHAQSWWNLSYAKLMYPNAQMQPRCISEMLSGIGSEETQKTFFAQYIKFLCSEQAQNPQESNGIVNDGILIDSSGLPNISRLPCAAIKTHNGDVKKDVRLIYVIQQHTGLPLYFQYVSDSGIDTRAISKAVSELRNNSIDTKWALVDAGYYTGSNADALFSEGISFAARVGANHPIFREAVAKAIDTLRSSKNMVIYENRLYYIADIECMIGANVDHKAYGYLCLDENMWHAEQIAYLASSDYDGVIDQEARDELAEKGLFMLVSTRKLKKDDVLSLYYTRDQVENVFEIDEQCADIASVYYQTEETFRGHLLMTFITSVIHKLLSNALCKAGHSVMDVLTAAHDLQCLVYDGEVLPNDAQSEITDPFRILNIDIPDSIPLSTATNRRHIASRKQQEPG